MATSTFVLRDAQQTDFEQLPAIYNQARESVSCFPDQPVNIREMFELIQGERVCVAELKQKIVGFVSIWEPDRFIHHLYVLPTCQNQGVGSALLQFCEQEYGASLSLKCEVANDQALAFYQNKGWIARETGVGVYGPWERLYSPVEQ
jgi:ribosomal protein S18 acetylase RimI-like enzyme